MRLVWARVMQYGGIRTITLPMGRVSTPRLAMASHTRIPARSRNAYGSRARQSFTSSIPAINPTCRNIADVRQRPKRLQLLMQRFLERLP